MNEWYDWRYERATVFWPIKIFWWRAAGIIRVHDDKDKIPGDYHCIGLIIVKNRKYEVMGFITKRDRPPTAEFREFYKYLASLGLTKLRHVRAKDGEVTIVGVEGAILPNSSKHGGK
jgi:hypothetical protein